MHCSKVVLKKSSVNRVWCDVMSFNLRQDTTRGSIFLHRLGFQISRFFKADLLSSGSHIDVFDILTETNLHLRIGELEDLAQLIMRQYSTRQCNTVRGDVTFFWMKMSASMAARNKEFSVIYRAVQHKMKEGSPIPRKAVLLWITCRPTTRISQ